MKQHREVKRVCVENSIEKVGCVMEKGKIYNLKKSFGFVDVKALNCSYNVTGETMKKVKLTPGNSGRFNRDLRNLM